MFLIVERSKGCKESLHCGHEKHVFLTHHNYFEGSIIFQLLFSLQQPFLGENSTKVLIFGYLLARKHPPLLPFLQNFSSSSKDELIQLL